MTQEECIGFRKAFVAGTLVPRVERAIESLRSCRLCPRECGADRLSGREGACRTGRLARVASWGPHHGEERCLSGRRGSGTIFFSCCNLRCVFCQNADLSQEPAGREMDAGEIAALLLDLQDRGCHNINLVTPSHVVPQILEALAIAAGRGLRLPIVHNSSGYDGPEALALLDGLIDIYMPDFKVWTPATAERLLGARGYPEAARKAFLEMHRQVGPLEIDPRSGLARRGVLVRHLVLPGLVDESASIFRFLAEVSAETYVNVMGQYHPANRAPEMPGIDRPVSDREMRDAFEAARAAGLRRFDR